MYLYLHEYRQVSHIILRYYQETKVLQTDRMIDGQTVRLDGQTQINILHFQFSGKQYFFLFQTTILVVFQ